MLASQARVSCSLSVYGQLQDLPCQEHHWKVEVDKRKFQLPMLHWIAGLPGLACSSCKQETF